MKQQPIVVATWHGLTPVGLVAVIGLGGFALVRTVLLIGCHISQPWTACEPERKDWQQQMAMVAGGFSLLFIRAPGTSDAPSGSTTVALPPWRRPEDEPVPVWEPDPEPEPTPEPSAGVINPDAPQPAVEHELTAAERMERAARRRRLGP
jgi:hypothetical protein